MEHRPQTTPLHLAPSCAATSIFLQLYLKPIVHISFSSSLLQMVFCCSLPLWSCGAHCNTCFTVLSLAPLQHVQNAAARLIFELTPRDHITPSLLQQLHWLPVRWRIEYKLCCIMHSVHTGRRLAYLKNTVQLAADRQSCLRQHQPIYFRGSKPKFGERAFSHTGPSTWNALPTYVRDVPNSDTFRKLLKTLF